MSFGLFVAQSWQMSRMGGMYVQLAVVAIREEEAVGSDIVKLSLVEKEDKENERASPPPFCLY